MPLTHYLNEILRDDIPDYQPLSDEEEKNLMGRVKNGDRGALEEFIKHNLRMVVKVANNYERKYVLTSEQKEDLIQEGNLFLYKSVESFNPEKGTRFITYIWRGLERKILEKIWEMRHIRIPTDLVHLRRKIFAVAMNYWSENNQFPSDKQIADELGVGVEKIKEVENYFRETLTSSLEMPIQGGDKELKSRISANNQIAGCLPPILEKECQMILVRYIDELDEEERTIIIEKYFHNLSRREISQKTGLSSQVLRHKERLILRKIKISLKGTDLEERASYINQ